MTVEAVLTTTQPVAAYGGLQLSRSVLVDLAAAVKSGSVPLQFEHDLRRPLDATVVDSGVRERADGYNEAWAILEIDQEQWATWRDHLDKVGASGGMSFTMSTPLASFHDRTVTSSPISVSADASHFPDELTIVTAHKIARLGPTSADRLYQLQADHPARVILSYAVDLVLAVPPGLLGNYLFEVVKPFLLHRRRSDGPDRRTILEFQIGSESHPRFINAHLETESDDVARDAIAALIELGGRPGRYEYSGTEWLALGQPSGTNADQIDEIGPT